MLEIECVFKYAKNLIFANNLDEVISKIKTIFEIFLIRLHFWNNEYIKKLQKEMKEMDYLISEMPIAYVELTDYLIITKWNKSAKKIFGYTEEEALGKNILHLLSAEINENDFISEFNKSSVSYFVHAKSKSGDEVDSEWYLVNSKTEDKHFLHSLMIVDITEREKIRHSLEKAEEMLLQNFRYMATNIHDIKNMLFPIVIYSEMLMTDDFSPEKIKSLAMQLNKNANNLIEFSTNILNASKVKMGSMNIERHEFNLYNRIQDVIIVLEANISQKELTVSNNVPFNQNVYADEELIGSVLFNLLGNAIKFTPQCGEITIYSNVIDCGLIEISIKDTGIGVKEEMIEKLFAHDAYFSSEGTRGEKGTGMGLISCKDFVKKNNGTIKVKNNADGVGATFSFTLPAF